MKIQKIDAGRQVVSHWSGGTTRQLAIEPPGADYAERDFLWRLSSATVELAESDFTPLPDYRRILMILRGTLTLSHDGGAERMLRELEQESFDGASATKSRGQVVDFNLMLRKGLCRGEVDARALAPGESFRESFSVKAPDTLFAYCFQGGLVARCPVRESLTLAAGEGLRMERDAGGAVLPWEFTNVCGAERAVLVLAAIRRTENAGTSTEIPG